MELKFFYSPGCPYCRQAEYLIGQLVKEHPEYGKIDIRRIDETRESAVAERYDYWYVPSFFLGEEKLYEADSSDTEETVKKKLSDVLKKAEESK